MGKWTGRSLVISISWLLLISQPSFSQPQFNESQSLITNSPTNSLNGAIASQNQLPQRAVIDEPLCFMRTSDGQLINLERLCGKTSGQSADQSAGFHYSANGYRISRFRRNCEMMRCAVRSY